MKTLPKSFIHHVRERFASPMSNFLDLFRQLVIEN